MHMLSTWRQARRDSAAVAAMEREHRLLVRQHEALSGAGDARSGGSPAGDDEAGRAAVRDQRPARQLTAARPRAATGRASAASLGAVSFETAIYQWQQGERRLQAAPRRARARCSSASPTRWWRSCAGAWAGASRRRSSWSCTKRAPLVPAGGDEAGARRIRGRGRRASSWTRRSRATCARPPTTPGGAQGAQRVARSALVVLADAADDDPVLLDRDLDRPVPGPVLGVDRVVLDGGVEPQAVALLAVVEGALRAGRCCARSERRPRPPRRLRRRVRVPLASASSSAPRRRRRFGRRARLRLGRARPRLRPPRARRRSARRPRRAGRSPRGSRRRAAPSGASSSLTSSFWRLNCSMSRTVTSSWWATQASVRPCRTQARIWFRCGRRDFRGMDGPGD